MRGVATRHVKTWMLGAPIVLVVGWFVLHSFGTREVDAIQSLPGTARVAPIRDSIRMSGKVVSISRRGERIAVLSSQGSVTVLTKGLDVVQSWSTMDSGPSTQTGAPLSITWLPNGDLAVWFPELSLVEIYDERGVGRGVHEVPVTPEDLYLGRPYPRTPPRLHGRLVATEDGRFLTEVRSRESEYRQDRTRDSSVPAALLRVGQGVRVDTIFAFSAPSYGRPLMGQWLCCGPARYFTPQPWWDIAEDGRLAVMDGQVPQVSILGPAGDVQHVFNWESPLDSLSDADLRVGVRGELRRQAEGRAPLAGINAFRMVRSLPSIEYGVFPTKPAATQLLWRGADELWVRRFAVDAIPLGLSAVWDVYSLRDGWLAPIALGGGIVHSLGSDIGVVSTFDPGRKETVVSTVELVKARPNSDGAEANL